jgi:aminoglycoside phosphotransferase (APT) family kinase protein
MVDPALFAELRDLCLRSFPERLGQRLSHVEVIDSTVEVIDSTAESVHLPGKTTALEHHPTLAFTLSWREGIRPCVERLLLRRYPDDRTWWVQHDAQKARREWSVMRWLYGCGLPVPRVYALGALDPDPFLLVERPIGQRLAWSANEPEKATASTRAQPPREHIDRLAALLARLHRLTPPGSVREVLPHVDARESLAQAVRIAQQCEDHLLMEAIHELIEAKVEACPPCVLHGDPRLADCLYDARGITTWLNWENSALGDPRWDVACLVSELQSSTANALSDRLCERYGDRAGLSLRDMPYWQALAALHCWTMAQQAQAMPGAKERSRYSTQLERHHKEAWSALARFRALKATITT